MTMESDANFEEKQTFGFEKDIRNLLNFYQSAQEFQNWDFDEILFPKQRLKFMRKLLVMTEKNEAKFEEELTSHIKIDMRNLTNLNHAPKNLNILHFTGLLLTKVYNI